MDIVRLNTDLTQPIKIDGLIDSFIASVDVRMSSKLLYRRTLKQFFTWISKKGYLLSECTRAQVIQYKEDLLGSGMSSLTVGSYITSLRLFYEWAEANKYYPNIAKSIRNPKRKQQFKKQPLLPSQATALLSYYRERDLRDFAIVNLCLRTGLRTIEVVEANIEDITFKGEQRILKLRGKGGYNKESYVVLTDKAYEPIAEYLDRRGAAPISSPLFISESNNNTGGRMTTRTISFIAKEGLKAIGLEDRTFTAHSLRHTAIVTCRRAGGTLEQAQALARHSTPATTQIYDSVFRDEQRYTNSGEALIDSLF